MGRVVGKEHVSRSIDIIHAICLIYSKSYYM
jgi:hypothetical protein